MHNLHPIKQLPTRERVALALRKAIFSQDVKEGDILTLEATAEKLGVSMTPVREAFQILARDGFLELRPNKGAVVLGVQGSLIQDHYELRTILESAACRLICEKGADLSDIIAAHEASFKSLQGPDPREYSNWNQRFHLAIWAACGNGRLRSMAAELWSGLSVGIDTSAVEFTQLSLQDHTAILEALQAGDAEQAGQRMYVHVIRSTEEMLALCRPSVPCGG